MTYFSIIQILLGIISFLMGFSFIHQKTHKIPNYLELFPIGFICSAAYPVGQGFFFLFSILRTFLITFLSENNTNYLLLMLFVAMALLVINKDSIKYLFSRKKNECSSIFYLFCITLVLTSIFNFTTVSADSLTHLSLAHLLYRFGFISIYDQDSIHGFIHRSLFLSSNMSLAECFNMHYFTYFQPLYCFSFAALSLSTINKSLPLAKNILLTLLLIATPMFWIHVFYIHNNILSGTYLILFYILMKKAFLIKKEHHETHFPLRILSLISICIVFSRMENSFFLALILFFIFLFSGFHLSLKNYYKIILPAVLSFSFSLIFMSMDFISEFKKSVFAFNFLWISMLLLCLIPFIVNLRAKHHHRIFIIIKYFPGLVLVFLSYFFPEKFIISIVAFSSNLLQFYWGPFWIFLFTMIISLYLKSNKSLTQTQIEIGYFLFISILFMFLGILGRNPLRVGSGDSLNRMMLQQIPFYLYFIKDFFGENVQTQQNPNSTS